ncbi:MAG: NADH:ubiquinone reductase (Na(+)-transporting) subunit C [Planctomycetes bacterium]|nr:NADH:ubiquinone reductase (Na(+)-transporting) subunit C [Planctomycetota bacterium]
MNTNSNSYVMVFAVAVCVIISTMLAVLANSLRSTQDAAKEFDRQKNVMLAAGLIERGDLRPRAELEKLYQDRVTEQLVDTETGEVVDPAKVEAKGKRYRSVATTKSADGKLEAIVLPVSGKGLWSTLYAYLALEPDANTVRGITFYEHGETPGLGGEVENAAWTATWKGKTIFDADHKLVSITLKKGKVDPAIEREKKHMVDGLSGATLTCKGVTNFLLSDLQAFQTYLGRMAKQN